ncbi:NAD(P)-dependent oxidoreductase [Desulfosporosinus sp. FKA]|uniref:NAD-dependent epimerase/dehydratase family protein n=1 Tax=Desulfosporosinus sp. FKA TaxID=1969834 RepID=UPI000B4A27A0|nr:NAD(P)-dependent oxidoreductase [Desulfosporosinus sp. FKA]
MKSAIVSGATGFIGVHLCEDLLSHGISVTALVRQNSRNISRLPAGVNVIHCDLDSLNNVELFPANVFYHLAWEGATGEERTNPLLQIRNAERTIEALNFAIKAKCEKFVGLGTVYERLLPQVVDFAGFRKSDYYLLSKNYAHEMCDKIAYQYNMPFVWATMFQPIGKYIKSEQISAYVIKCLRNNKSPQIGNGLQPFDITAVENIAYGLRLLGECDVPKRNYYIGGGEPKMMREYIEAIHSIIKSEVPLHFGDRKDDGLRFNFAWYDIQNLKNDAGYVPEVTFENAVKNTLEWISNSEYLEV